MHKKNTKGFTLIELSISLVIIGLIVGGILGARDLISQAELRSVMKDVSGYRTAINTFNLKYNGLPGDIINASSYWPSCDATPANCNGNGDGGLGTVEGKRGWQQLSDSGLIPGSYNGANAAPVVLDEQVPSSSVEGGGYTLLTGTGASPSAGKNLILFGIPISTGAITGGNVLSPPDVKAIDDKMDDGLPGQGKVRSRGGWNGGSIDPDCVDGSLPNTSFELDQTEPQCQVEFLLDLQ